MQRRFNSYFFYFGSIFLAMQLASPSYAMYPVGKKAKQEKNEKRPEKRRAESPPPPAAAEVPSSKKPTPALPEFEIKETADGYEVSDPSIKQPFNFPKAQGIDVKGVLEAILKDRVAAFQAGGEFSRIPLGTILTNRRHSLFHLAAYVGSKNLTSHFLSTQLAQMPLVKSNDGATPLHIAAQVGQIEVLKILLTTPMAQMPLVKSNIGATPLHSAAASGQIEALKILLPTPMAQMPSLKIKVVSASF